MTMRPFLQVSGIYVLLVLFFVFPSSCAFLPLQMQARRSNEQLSSSSSSTKQVTSLFALYSPGRSAQRSSPGRNDFKSKRQSRVGQFVHTELARILHTGNIKGDVDFIDKELRQRISIVGVDVSPDLRQARVTVSIRKSTSTEDDNHSNPAVDRRRAYSWLVRNTKPLRHSLAQRMSHMKTSPTLTFVRVDVGAAVDVMYLIDKAAQGYQRETTDDTFPRGFVEGMDFDEEFDADEWDEDDDDSFFDVD